MTFRTPPIVAPNGKPWNFVLLNGDDWMVDTYQNMPLFLANWAQDFTFYPNASCNMPLCFPGRAATYTGWRIERHDCAGNSDGERYVASGAIDNTIFSNLARAGYDTAMVGKIYNELGKPNGWGELPWFHPGVRFMRGQWGDPAYFDWNEISEAGTILTAHGSADTNTTGTDYAVDVERLRIIEFFDSVPANRPWVLVHASKGTHSDVGGAAVPPARYASAAVNIVSDGTFGIEPASVGIPPWGNAVALLPFTSTRRDEKINEHTLSLQTALAVDECLHTVLQSLAARGWDQNTIIILKTDNAHASGELCFDAKGVPHRSATDILLSVKVPGLKGGTSYAPVSDIDIAPFIYAMAGVRPMITCHGMDFSPTLLDKAHPFRQAAPISNPEKDSPLFKALQFGGNPGRMHYRILPESENGGAQVGGYIDAAQSYNAVVPGDAALLEFIERVNY